MKNYLIFSIILLILVPSNLEAGRRSSGKRFGIGVKQGLQPLITDFEASNKRTIDHANVKITERLNQVNDILNEGDKIAKDNLRILNKMVENQLYQFESGNKRNLEYFGAILDKNIVEINKTLGNNLEIIDNISNNVMKDFDNTIKDAIESLDESFENGIGTFDVATTKNAYVFENSLRNSAQIVLSIAVFLLLLNWLVIRFFAKKDIINNYKKEINKKNIITLVSRLIICFIASFFTYIIFNIFPNNAKKDMKHLVHNYEKKLNDRLYDLKLKDVTLISRKLEILDMFGQYTKYPTDYISDKSELIRNLFYRPIFILTEDDINNTKNQLSILENSLKEKNLSDTDLFIVKSYFLWKTAENKKDEYLSAQYSCLSLEKSKDKKLILSGLARDIIKNYLNSPSPNEIIFNENEYPYKVFNPTDMHKLLSENQDRKVIGSIQHILDFNDRSRKLKAYTETKYLEVLNILYRGYDTGGKYFFLNKGELSEIKNICKTVFEYWNTFYEEVNNSELSYSEELKKASSSLSDCLLLKFQDFDYFLKEGKNFVASKKPFDPNDIFLSDQRKHLINQLKNTSGIQNYNIVKYSNENRTTWNTFVSFEELNFKSYKAPIVKKTISEDDIKKLIHVSNILQLYKYDMNWDGEIEEITPTAYSSYLIESHNLPKNKYKLLINFSNHLI